MKLIWTRLAHQDRKDIREYIVGDNPAAALALDNLFEEKSKHLPSHPQLGRLGCVKGTRELIVHQNYILVYDIAGDEIRILRVLHAARKWPLTN